MFRWFAQLKVARKLALGFGLVLALMMCTLGVDMLASTEQAAVASRLVSHLYPARQTAREIVTLVRVADDDGAWYIMARDRTQAAALLHTYYQEEQHLRELLAKAGILADTVEQRQTMAQFATFYFGQGGYYDGNEAVFALKRAGEMQAAYDGYVHVPYIPSLGAAQVYIDIVEREIAQQTVQEEDANRLVLLLSLTVGGLTAFLGTGIATLIARSITRPLTQVQEAAQQVSAIDVANLARGLTALGQGDLTVTALTGSTPPRYESRDEIGQTAQAMRTIIADIHRTVGGYESARLELQRLYGQLAEKHGVLQRLSVTDALTGLPNRAGLLERVKEARLSVEQAAGSMALLTLDLDRFKEVNDTFGHQLGDQLLQQVGLRLRQAVSAATVARLGSDEFAVFLPTADEAHARLVAAALCAALEESFLVEDNLLQVEVSIGIALYPAYGSDPLILLRHADVAMYAAKRGHEACAMYDASHAQDSRHRLALLGDLRKAIADGELRLYYQPKAELHTGLVHGVEALVRWQHPTQGFVPPDQFIPLAEQTGLIVPLTRWVVETAVQQCRRWLDEGLELAVAVNLSMWNLRDGSLPETITALLTRYEVPPHLLCVEVTESAVMIDAEHTLQALHRLFALGVRIAIDDYGTGYASLSYLKHLPADELKIDRAFVQHLTTDGADQAIVRSTINMAHALGVRVVAEGVEDQATWNLLAALGCDIAQGYYLSRPVPAQDLKHWLAERHAAVAV